MKTDRELLELAAKAAGMVGEYKREHQTYGDQWVDGLDIGARFWWNPLTDDGDALRLAVILDIYFMVVREQGYVVARVRNGARQAFIEQIGDDVFAATRCAIILAAAAIGEAMP